MQPEAKRAFEHALDCERRGDTSAALASYLNALDHEPDDLDIAFRTATALLREGHLDEAASQLRRIVFVDPDHIAARANLGNCQLLTGELENAAGNFEAVLKASPDNHNALFGLASVYLRQQKFGEARVPAERLLGLLPQSAPALTLFAQACARDPQSARAAAAYRQALSIDPAYYPALSGLAELSVRRKKFDEALDYVEQACRFAPSDAGLYRLKATALEGLGTLDAAETALEKALSFAGLDDRPAILTALSAICRKLGKPGEALIHAEEAWSRNPKSRELGNALGACLKALGKTQMAKAVLTAVARGDELPEELVENIRSLVLEFRQERIAASAPSTDQTLEDGISADTMPGGKASPASEATGLVERSDELSDEQPTGE
ncbi:tetratricopeptide repeat protein [Roseibium sp.]|uniref:tetratricopeptide repeat protein n=1 Tax=Roseibium sp. TaxID=1936156 RepID=UPI003A97B3D7